MKTTANLGLKKPDGTDIVNIEEINSNMDKLDTEINKKANTTHNHDEKYYTKSSMDTKLDTKSDVDHTHDSRYYTESEINTRLSSKSNTNHNHDSSYYKKSEVDSKINGVKADIGNKAQLETQEKANLVGAINEVFQSGSNFKEQIASAITAKGQCTSKDDQLETFVANISNVGSEVNLPIKQLVLGKDMKSGDILYDASINPMIISCDELKRGYLNEDLIYIHLGNNRFMFFYDGEGDIMGKYSNKEIRLAYKGFNGFYAYHGVIVDDNQYTVYVALKCKYYNKVRDMIFRFDFWDNGTVSIDGYSPCDIANEFHDLNSEKGVKLVNQLSNLIAGVTDGNKGKIALIATTGDNVCMKYTRIFSENCIELFDMIGCTANNILIAYKDNEGALKLSHYNFESNNILTEITLAVAENIDTKRIIKINDTVYVIIYNTGEAVKKVYYSVINLTDDFNLIRVADIKIFEEEDINIHGYVVKNDMLIITHNDNKITSFNINKVTGELLSIGKTRITPYKFIQSAKNCEVRLGGYNGRITMEAKMNIDTIINGIIKEDGKKGDTVDIYSLHI